MNAQRVWHIVEPSTGTTTEEVDELFRRRIGEGSISRDTLVWTSGMADWEPAGQIAGLFSPPPLPEGVLPQPAVPPIGTPGTQRRPWRK